MMLWIDNVHKRRAGHDEQLCSSLVEQFFHRCSKWSSLFDINCFRYLHVQQLSATELHIVLLMSNMEGVRQHSWLFVQAFSSSPQLRPPNIIETTPHHLLIETTPLHSLIETNSSPSFVDWNNIPSLVDWFAHWLEFYSNGPLRSDLTLLYCNKWLCCCPAPCNRGWNQQQLK